ncbi:MAG: tyrosine-type recombinase/integrase [Melioribacteraceae bacterium]|nr:MAG: tyrosine-type recombinase/integrase [Melioribacteraceae bacterium]
MKFSDIKFSSEYIIKKFKEAVRKTELDESLHLHSLRHSFCSNLVSKNISLYTVKELAGHEDISTTAIYSHVQFGALAKTVNSLDKKRDYAFIGF